MGKIILFFLLFTANTVYSGDSRYFDGDDFIWVTSSAFSFAVTTWTVEMNFKPAEFLTADDGKNTLYHEHQAVYFTVRGDGGNIGKISIYAGVYLFSTGVLKLNQWHHVAYTYENSVVKIYIDGKLDSTQAGTALAMGTDRIAIGSESGTARFCKGYIDNVRKWDYARTENQINNWAWRDFPGRAPGLFINLKFDPEAGGFKDFSGYGHHTKEITGTLSSGNAPTLRLVD